MNELLNLLKGGHSYSIEMLAEKLNTTTDDITRRIEFLERAGIIRRVLNIKNDCSKGCPALAHGGGCSSCPGCKAHGGKSGTSSCKSCLPEDGFKNMGEMWEVV